MDFKGVSQDSCEVYIIDDKVHDEDLESGYPLSGSRGDFVWSLLGSMSLLDKVRVGNWEGNGPDEVKEDIIKSNPKVVVGLGSKLMNLFVATQRKITDMSGVVTDIDINGVKFKYLVLMSPSYILNRMEDSDLILRFSQDLYKSFQLVNGEYKDILKDKEILSAHSFEEFKEIYESRFVNDSKISYDIETNARPIYMDGSRIVGFSIGNKKSGVYVSISALDFEMSEEEEDKIWDYMINEVFEKKDKLIIHNTMYERPYTLYCKNYEIGFDKADDTLVMARLLKGAKEGAGLKYQAQKNLQYPDWETDLTTYISGFRDVVDRIAFGPKKFAGVWSEIFDNKVGVFDVTDTESFSNLSEDDQVEIISIIDKLKSPLIDLYSEKEISELGELLSDKFITVYNQGGIVDSTIPYNYIPDRVLSKYGAVDSISTYDLYDYFNEMMDRDSTDKVDLHKGYQNWLEHMYVAYIMERNGLYWNEELVKKDEEFLTNQATNCLKSMLKSPAFKPFVLSACGWKYKPLILSDYLPQIAESQGYSVEYSVDTGKYVVKYCGKRATKGCLDNITIPDNFKSQYEEIVYQMFNEEVEKASHYEELKDIYNPSSPTQSDIPRKILINDTLQMGGRVVQLHTLSVSPEFENIIDSLPVVDQKFLKVASLLCEVGDLKSMYGDEWASKRKEIFEGFTVMYNSIRNRVQSPEIKSILDNPCPVSIESFDDGGIIDVYNNLVVTGIDQDDRSTWTPQFEWMINFRLFKKSAKIISSYIEGSVGRQSVVVVDKEKVKRGDHCVPRKRYYSSVIAPDEDYVMAAKWSPNTAETGRWRSAQHCHPGWTQIKLADGRDLPIEEVVNEFNQGKSLYVYSSTINSSQRIDESCEYRVAKVQEAYLSHYATEFVRLTLDNGEVVDMTPDHKMIRRDGTVDYAINIEEGDGLYPAYFKEDDKGYLMILSQGTWKYCHYLADEYNERHGLAREVPEEEYISVNGKYQPGWCRHHLDFNFRNNSPENVMRVGRAVHYTKYHMGNPEYYSKSWEHRRERGNDPCPDYYGRLLKKASEDPEFERKWKKAKHDSGLESMKRFWASEDFKKAHVERNKVRGLNKAVQLLSTIYDKDNDCITINEEVYETLRKSQGRSSMGIITWKSLMKYIDTDSLKEMVRDFAYRNHSVVRKEVVTLEEPIPVYSLSIEQDSPNYVVSAGVCIKNTIPWGSQVKKYYTSRFVGGTCLAPDYSQMEVRTLAAISKDENMLNLFYSGRDFHSETAAQVWQKPVEEVTTAERRFSKTACWFGDTKIKLLDGSSKTIQEMYESGNKEWDVYSFDIDEEHFRPGKTYDVQLTKKVTEYAEVTLDNGATLRCTVDHPFLTRKGDYVRADSLHEGQKLESLFTRYSPRGTMLGYEQYFDTRHQFVCGTRNPSLKQIRYGKWMMTHRTVYGSHRSGFQIDHINGKKYDNRPSNLQELNFVDNRSKTLMRVELNDKFNSLPLIVKRMKLMKSLGEDLQDYDKHHSGLGDRFYSTLNDYLPMEDIWNRLEWYEDTYINVRRTEGCVDMARDKRTEEPCRRVVKVEIKTCDPTPVYDLSVERYHNYAVDLGDESAIYVHNTFSLLYGAMEESFAKNYCNGDLAMAQKIYGGFFRAYPRVKEWVDERHAEVQRDHRVSLELSNRFIPILPEGEGKGALNSMLRKSQNYPIQAQSADLTGCVIFDLQKYIEENNMKSLVIMYVHDSIEVDVYPYELIQLVDKLKVLLNESPMRRMGLPSKADVTLGKSLGHEIEMEGIEYNQDFTEGVISLKGYQDEIYETIDNWKNAYKTVEIFDEDWKEEFVSMSELFILRKAYSPTLGTLRHKGTCKVRIKYYS